MILQLRAAVRVQQFVVMWWPTMELQQGEVSIEFELLTKIVSEMGPDRPSWSRLIFQAMCYKCVTNQNKCVTNQNKARKVWIHISVWYIWLCCVISLLRMHYIVYIYIYIYTYNGVLLMPGIIKENARLNYLSARYTRMYAYFLFSKFSAL